MNTREIYRAGRVPFMGLELGVAPGALIPREETELLGRAALAAIRQAPAARARVIDMCCGSGNLACAIAHHAPLCEVWASDLTDGCVEVARRNVERLGLSGRVRVLQGDLFQGLAGAALEGAVDVIVCNPPYISGKRLEGDRAALLEHEPREAFDGGPYGLSIHQRVLAEAPAFLRPGGALLFEVGLGQDRQVAALFRRARIYEDIRVVPDASGQGRVVCGRRTAASIPASPE
jgi:release factor glutamine methyltransferase